MQASGPEFRTPLVKLDTVHTAVTSAPLLQDRERDKAKTESLQVGGPVSLSYASKNKKPHSLAGGGSTYL
jgi:hypothetical protein